MDRVNWLQVNALLFGGALVAVGVFFSAVAPPGGVDPLAVASVIVGGATFALGALSWWIRGWAREIRRSREERASRR